MKGQVKDYVGLVTVRVSKRSRNDLARVFTDDPGRRSIRMTGCVFQGTGLYGEAVAVVSFAHTTDDPTRVPHDVQERVEKMMARTAHETVGIVFGEAP